MSLRVFSSLPSSSSSSIAVFNTARNGSLMMTSRWHSLLSSTTAPFLLSTMRYASSSSASAKKSASKNANSTNGKDTKRKKDAAADKITRDDDAGNQAKKPTSPTQNPADATAATSPSSAAPSSSSNIVGSQKHPQQSGGNGLEEKSLNKQSQRDDLSMDLEVEAIRWEVPEVTDRIVDEKGQYIVSKTPWTKRGELAYTAPPPPGPLEARYGYQIVVVKRPQSYWQWYRTQIHMFSFGHLMYQMAFCLAVAWLITWVQLESEYVYAEMRRPGNMAGDVLGKGDPNRHQKKITVSPEERDEVLQAMQMAFMDANDMASRATKDYKMKKIARPKDLKAEDFLRGGSQTMS